MKLFLASLLLLALMPASAADLRIDYSRCGYKLSAEAIPDVPCRLYVDCRSGDQYARLQHAIDLVSRMKPDRKTGLRGAVLLGEGTFSISRPLRISTAGVVLRGTNRLKTTVRKTGVDRGAAIYIEGQPAVARDTVRLVANVPLGQTTITTDGSLRVGDMVVVHRRSTQQWISRLGCASFGGGDKLGYWAWHPGDEDVEWTRRVVAASGTTATLDAPLTMAIDVAEGPCLVIRKSFDGYVAYCGVENMTVESSVAPDAPADEDHCWDGISISRAHDCFVRRVVFHHLAGSAVVVQREAGQCTVEDCASYDPVSEIGGWRRRTFLVRGERCLMQRLWSERGIHDFAVADCAAGPTAFVCCESYDSQGYSGSIGPWATGILFDDVNIDGNDLKFTDLGLEKFGTGWNAANSVFYQCTAAGIFCSDPDSANRNEGHGCWAQFNGTSLYTDCNNHVKPWSIFAQQLSARIGADKADAICHTLVRQTGGASNNPTPEEAAALVAQAHQPRVTMEMWIDSVPYTASVSSKGVRQLGDYTAPVAQGGEARGQLAVSHGRLTIDGRLLVGGRHDTPWWNGRARYNKLATATYALTRFVPGIEDNGATTRVDSVVALMRREGTAVFGQHYGLWYDRRRDDHERVRRRDGDVWAPFYEQPYARTGQGKAWDGLSLYDLRRPNGWYYERLRQFCRASEADGLVLLNQHYFQHNILEAGAHWVDCPWRRANNVNGTPTPEPVPFTGDKRVFVADRFYNLDDSLNRRLHHDYIFTQLDELKDEPNVIHSIGEEYTGPLSFTRFWLQTIKEWAAKNGRKPKVMLSVNKNVQDSLLQDPMVSDVISAIGIEQWWQTEKGLYAPDGGQNLAPRQYSRRLRPGRVSFETVYRSVSEYRRRYPDKAVCYYAQAYPQMAWAVLMAGGSCPSLRIADKALLAALTDMNQTSTADGAYILSDGQGRCLVYATRSATLPLPAGTYRMSAVSERQGTTSPLPNITSQGAVTLPSKGIFLIIKK